MVGSWLMTNSSKLKDKHMFCPRIMINSIRQSTWMSDLRWGQGEPRTFNFSFHFIRQQPIYKEGGVHKIRYKYGECRGWVTFCTDININKPQPRITLAWTTTNGEWTPLFNRRILWGFMEKHHIHMCIIYDRTSGSVYLPVKYFVKQPATPVYFAYAVLIFKLAYWVRAFLLFIWTYIRHLFLLENNLLCRHFHIQAFIIWYCLCWFSTFGNIIIYKHSPPTLTFEFINPNL